MGVTPPSTWPWLDHPVSGLLPATERPVQTRFRSAFAYRLKLAANRNSLTHYTKGTPSPHQTLACHRRLRLLVGIRFQVSFTPLSGCFSPFPHGTCSLSVTREYLGLEGGPPMFRQDFTCPALLKDAHVFTHTGLSPAMAGLSRPFCLSHEHHWPVPLSLATTDGISLMSVPPGTEMFQFPGFASYHYGFMIRYPCGWVAPFGYPRIKACSRLPVAFRSVPRPSSPPGAKASTECPYHTPIQL